MAGTARFFVPGRIEVLGKHTDYAGGRSLLVAVDRGFTVVASPADDPVVRVVDAASGGAVELPLDDRPGPRPAEPPAGAPGWALYPRTVVRRVEADFPGVLRGCRIELRSDLPASAGLSSSSALVVAVFLALDAVSGLSGTERYRSALPDRLALAGYLGAVERGSPFPGLDGNGAEGVGTRGGSEDHVAILCAVEGAVLRCAFEPVRAEGTAPVPDGWVFAVAASGVRAPKAGAVRDRYNRLSDDAARAAELWRAATAAGHPHLGAVLGEPDGLARLRSALWCAARPGERDRLRRRVRHFAAESCELVPAGFEALRAGDMERFGRVADRSQALAGELLGNQVPETEFLARSARELGAAAASAFGAGFGGSVWALVPAADPDAFLHRWRDRYLSAFPARAGGSFFATPPGPPARRL